jgi:plastocyanin
MRHGTSSPLRALLATGLLAAVAGLGLATVAAPASYAGARAGAVKVTGTADNKFNPADITAAADAAGKVTIDFTAAAGGAPHTFTGDDPKFDTGIVNAGSSKTVTFAAKPGKYQVYCSLHKTSGMVGTLTVTAAGATNPDASASATGGASQPPASASASASVGSGAQGVGAPTPTAAAGSASAEAGVPGVEGNKELASIEEERAAQHGAVSGFRFFTMVAVAFLVILGAAVLFSTRPRRATGR